MLSDPQRLFLCSSPYHVMIAHSVLEWLWETGEPRGQNHLVLTGVSTPASTADLTIEAWWDGIHDYHPNCRRSKPFEVLPAVDRWVDVTLGSRARERVMEVFTGNDLEWTNQLLITAFHTRRLALFEDGLGAYQRSRDSGPARQFVRLVGYKGLFGKRYFNVRGISLTPAERFFALRPNAFPLAPGSAQRLHVISFESGKYATAIRERFQTRLEGWAHVSGGLIISEGLAETFQVTPAEECEVYRKLAAIVEPKSAGIVWIKRHPAEKPEDFARKRESVAARPEASAELRDVAGDWLPIEVMALCGFPFDPVIGLCSTALVNLKLLAPGIEVMSGFDLMPDRWRRRNGVTRQTLERVGVTLVARQGPDRPEVQVS